MELYNWIPTTCSPDRHPIKVLAGDFEFLNEPKVLIPCSNICNNGWGEIGLVNLTENDFHAIPYRIDITWFSLVENKFYKGDFVLPEQKIRQLFSEGFKNPANDENTTYEFIIAGMAPNGLVAVWAAGHGIVTELCFFQAGETNIEWGKLNDNPSDTRQAYVERKLKLALKDEDILLLKENAELNREWHKYHIRYHWTPICLGNIEPVNLWLFSSNGECEFIRFNTNTPKHSQLRSGMRKLIFRWRGVSGKRFVSYIYFDLQEVMAIFQKLYSYDAEATYQLQIEFNSVSNLVELFLASNTFFYEFVKCNAKIYTETSP
ncbi:MAG: DUF2931 family protein [Ginsengibacter sp.]